jgi:MFS family permease
MFRAPRKAIDKFEREWNYDASHIRNMVDARRRAAWLVSRVAALLATAAVVGGFGLAAPAAADVSLQPAAASAYTMSPERIAASMAAVLGLVGAVIGGLALARSADRIGTSNGRRGAIVALVLGPIGLVIGGLVVATADGGLGTGHGLGGGIVAMIVGLIGMALGGLALARSRRTG